ncbi:tetratricopeptide repeat protein [Kordia algicida OT-1]|uniref:Aerotolerance-related exported protein n=1 Tax=Kordia algicida OT-1 TaxID=391587 RepID=A9DQT1_9FLAO|nr:tetratricopeptide repeat protein [Kordia algicida]EDP96691.1 aerotolerance-related exported protein [Kordia algicida OT-1]
MKYVKHIWIVLLTVAIANGQNKEAEQIKKESNNYTYKANKALEDDSFVDAEAEYRKAISKDGENATAKYNLGNAYYQNESYEEAFNRYKQAAEVAMTKAEKHSAYHNMGNVFMKNKEYEKAVAAYKNALRNNPSDDETRYNFALAKEMLEKNPPKEDDKDKKDKDKKEENKEQDKKDQNDKDQKDKNEDKGDKEKDEGGKDDKDKDGKGDQEKDKKKQDDKNDQNKADEKKDDKKQQQQPKPNQLSPQQVKSLLQAMNNAEKKTQDKLNEKKAKGIKVKAEKDW